VNKDKDYVFDASERGNEGTPKRVAFIKKQIPARFTTEKEEDSLVMAFPHLVVREVISFEVVVIILSILSLFFDAPLEEIANSEHTPNPAKAPWYFIGLQELLHYFPPVVAGVLLPSLVIVALVVIPYFEINIKRDGLWKEDKKKTFYMLTLGVGAFTSLMAIFSCYPILVPTVLMFVIMLIPYFSQKETGMIGFLARQSLATWIMTWFVTLATVLTIIGALFRGPGWSWVWPWIDGIY
jgi:hypothetical protein